MGVFESIHYVSWAAVYAESLVSPPLNLPVLLVFQHKLERRLNVAYVARVRLRAPRLVRTRHFGRTSPTKTDGVQMSTSSFGNKEIELFR